MDPNVRHRKPEDTSQVSVQIQVQIQVQILDEEVSNASIAEWIPTADSKAVNIGWY